jgi:crotonobetainyl-CoA:carnitine CoA-transferase CaiB-like acyl-CoA transferase
MEILIWMGAAAALIGVAGLVFCVLQALRARRAGLDDDAMRAELQRLVVLNMTAFGISALGLAMVVAGILLS